MRITKVPIRLCAWGCAGWFAPLLFANQRRQVFLHQGPHDRCSKILNTTRVVSGGRSSEKRYQYFVTTAHPGTFEIAPKDKKVNTKLGLSDFYGKKLKY